MGQKVNVYMIRYVCESTGEKLWFPESVDFKVGNALCRMLAVSGQKPVMYRFRVDPSFLKTAWSFSKFSKSCQKAL